MLREEIEARKDPYRDKLDHKEDRTRFDISIVNTDNAALNFECLVINGEVNFNRVRFFNEEGIRESQNSLIEKARNPERSYLGPLFSSLSEPV